MQPTSSPRGSVHPGKVLRAYLPDGLAVSHAAERLGVTRQALSALLNGQAGVSASMALRLEAALGPRAEMWLMMQTHHDLWRARQRPPKIRRWINAKSVRTALAARRLKNFPSRIREGARD